MKIFKIIIPKIKHVKVENSKSKTQTAKNSEDGDDAADDDYEPEYDDDEEQDDDALFQDMDLEWRVKKVMKIMKKKLNIQM